jgi:hypothetical protein
VANFYFNLDYQKNQFENMIRLRYALENWLGAVMNMAVKDAVEDVVTFYVIGGKYLVPCSVILRASEQLKLGNSLKIYSSYEGHTDKDFARYSKDNGSIYSKYWVKDGDDWDPTPENKSEIDNLIGNRISIQTQFNFF